MRVPLPFLGGVSLLAAQVVSAVEERPLAKVITLLKDMQTQMTAEGEDDAKVHEKYQCWCKKENEEKTNIVKKQGSEMKRLDALAKGSFSEGQKKGEKLDDITEVVKCFFVGASSSCCLPPSAHRPPRFRR